MLLNDFFAYMYETIFQFYREGFSVDLHDNSMYEIVGSGSTLWAALIAFIYYKLIDRSSWASWYKWLAFGILTGSIPVFIFGWLHPKGNFDAQGLDYVLGDYLAFGGVSALLALFAYILFSNLIFRWFSTSCKSVPFPS